MEIYCRLLEVGALKHDNYRSCSSWIDVTPMDLRSRHPAILEQDFLLMDSAVEHSKKWDIVSLSLVVNFVPEPRDRGLWIHLFQTTCSCPTMAGRMLCMAHEMLSSGGILFLAVSLHLTITAIQLNMASASFSFLFLVLRIHVT